MQKMNVFNIDKCGDISLNYCDSVEDLLKAYDQINLLNQEVLVSLLNRIKDQEKLPPKAYKIVFDNIKNIGTAEEILTFVKDIMYFEKEKTLPQLDKFISNEIIIRDLYAKAMDIYVLSDLSEHLNDEIVTSIPDCNCTCLINFLLDMKLQDGENQEWLHNKVEYWRTEIANQFSSILYNTYTYHFEGISKNIFLHWCKANFSDGENLKSRGYNNFPETYFALIKYLDKLLEFQT